MVHQFIRLMVAGSMLALSGAAVAQKSAAEIPVETFFKRPQFFNMALAPNAEKLAAIVPFRGRNNLVVIDLASRTRKVITGYDEFDVASFEWISNTRLCLRAADAQDVSGNFTYRGAACVDHDGQNMRNFQYKQWSVLARANDGSPNVYAAMNERSRYSTDVYLFNTMTGRGQLLSADSPGEVNRWVLDRNNVARVAVSRPEPKDRYGERPSMLWYRDGADAKWEKLFQYNPETAGDAYIPIAFDYDNKTLYIAHNQGRDKMAVFKYDTAARKMGEMVFEDAMVDIEGGLVFDMQQKKLIGIRYLGADRPLSKWLDPEVDKFQKMVDATLPKTFNILSFPAEGGKRALVRSFSDVDPGMFHLLDRSKPSIESLMHTSEWIDPDIMSERKFITYKSRDGMTIPAWLTIPKGTNGKNLPLVVNIHGGPHVRGYSANAWGRPEAQFFASRGYAVLEPEPRGSLGYGKKHYLSSFKQWGQSMQDDITDGALHLVKEGVVDKGRMCLYGASYGGYATAMGLVKDPELWKCGVPFVAVTDLFKLQSATWSDTAEYSSTAGFKKVIGDSDADKEYFTKSSPALQAHRIKAPVMLAMGSEDVRVPMVHGTDLRDAIQKAGGQVDFIVYNGEAHGWNKDENVHDWYKRVDAFFARHLKGAKN